MLQFVGLRKQVFSKWNPVARVRIIKMLNLSMFHHTNFGELLV